MKANNPPYIFARAKMGYKQSTKACSLGVTSRNSDEDLILGISKLLISRFNFGEYARAASQRDLQKSGAPKAIYCLTGRSSRIVNVHGNTVNCAFPYVNERIGNANRHIGRLTD